MLDPQPLSREERDEYQRSGRINGLFVGNIAERYEATCVALEQERDDVREMFEDTKKVLEETMDERDQLRATVAQYEEALRSCVEEFDVAPDLLQKYKCISKQSAGNMRSALAAANALLESKPVQLLDMQEEK